MQHDNWNEMLTALVHARPGPMVPGAPLSACSTWGIGGPADLLLCPDSLETLCRVRRILWACNTPNVVIGAGSNLLFHDLGYRGVVLRMSGLFSRIIHQGDRLRVQAGLSVPWLARYCEHVGLSGLEHVIGIPGTVGGLVAMNGGSGGHAIGERVQNVRVVTAQGDIEELSATQCRFEYRNSLFLEDDYGGVLADVELKLTPGNRRAIRNEHRRILAERREKYPRPRVEPNCGSVFKHNEKMYSRFGPPGKVIEDCGCKGWRIGGAVVSHRHANFITTRPGARFSDVLQLLDLVRQMVAVRTGIRMESEVRFINDRNWAGPAHLAVEAMYGRDIQYAPTPELTVDTEPLLAS